MALALRTRCTTQTLTGDPLTQRFTLRPYQREAIASVLRHRKSGTRRMVVVLPTGSGKTVIFSELARMARRPVLVLAHRGELVQQAAEKIRRALGGDVPEDYVAVEQADARASDSAHVVVASIRSLHDRRLARLTRARSFGLVVYDECHHAPAEDNTRVLRSLGAFDADWSGTLVGFTATPSRGDGQGLDAVFETIAYTRTLPQMIRDGYLAPLRGYRVQTAADLQQVATTRSDLDVEELSEAVDIEDRNALVARSIQELARDRRTLAFCVTVAHARRLMRALSSVGVAAGMVWGEMRPDDRRDVLAAFRAGKLQVLTNVGVLTEGFDDPGVSCVAMARPTRSAGLYMQCVGRGTRLHPGKTDCLVLDFVDLSDLDLVTLPTLYGMPRDVDLQGEEAEETAREVRAVLAGHPGFEIPPGAITLQEIKDRAAAFDPLDQHVHADVRAISGNGWASLGRRGLVLHVLRRQGKLSEIRVLDSDAVPAARKRRKGRADRWQVWWDGKRVAAFSKVEQAIEAVDYEVEKKGRAWAQAASERAAWRQVPASVELKRALVEARSPGTAETVGDALQLLSFAEAWA